MQIITDALREAGIVGVGEAPSADEAQDELARLNSMLLEWQEGQQIDLGFYPQTVLTAEVAIPAWTNRAVVYSLALAASSDYQVDPPPQLVMMAREAFRTVLARSIDHEAVDLSHLPTGARQWSL